MDGTPFGRYRLLELLGSGGMGEVWRAYDTETHRIVAVKVVPARLVNDKVFQERFRREAYAAASLNEPHVVPIHHYGEIDVAVGDGLYGQEDSQVSFVIGDSHISVADDNTKQVSVYENRRLVRTMPTSMGMGGTERIAGQTISFWTQPGVYTLMGKSNPVVMDSSTYGLPINSRLGYKETINYATQISTDGVYLHELDSTAWARGNTNVSHGCLNLNSDNARWFYDFSVPGDVVEVVNTGGEPLQPWQNGDWSVPWNQWLQGGALS